MPYANNTTKQLIIMHACAVSSFPFSRARNIYLRYNSVLLLDSSFLIIAIDPLKPLLPTLNHRLIDKNYCASTITNSVRLTYLLTRIQLSYN